MAALFDIIYLIIISLLCLIGVLGSALIVTLNLLDWINSKRLNTCDRILVALGVSYASSECIHVGHLCSYMFWSETYVLNIICPLLVKLMKWTGSSGYWLASCLCVFYCVKIVDFNHHLFIWLKLRISNMVPRLLLGSVVGTLVLSIPIYWISYTDVTHTTIHILMANSSVPARDLELGKCFIVVHTVFGFIVPLLVDIAAITVILASLYRHTQRIKGNASGFSKPRMEAHFGALRMVGSLLLIYAVVILAQCVELISSSPMLDAVVWIIFAAAVPAQTIILILGKHQTKGWALEKSQIVEKVRRPFGEEITK